MRKLTKKLTVIYLKLQIPIMHRYFFKNLSKKRDYVQTHWNDLNSPFRFACQKWY